jgi:Zn-dependent protease
LAGPIYGLSAAAGAYAIHAAGGSPIWAAIGHFGAWVNLFNLAPVWQLDGAHAFKPLTRVERTAATAAIAVMFLLTREGLLVIVALLAALQAWHSDGRAPGDRVALGQFVALIVVLSWMCTLAAGGI